MIAAVMAATGLAAEMPLQDNANYAVQIGDFVVRSDEAADRTVISKPGDGAFEPWGFPASPRLFAVSDTGEEILALHNGKHVEDVSLFLIAATVYRRDAEGFAFQHYGLERMIPRNRLRLGEAEGLRWLDRYETASDRWILHLVDENRVEIPFR